jgi:hypothetical protein
MKNQQVFYLIGRCLSLSDNPANKDSIIQAFHQPDMDWQKFAGIASNHLIIPCLYIQLRNNGLLPDLPAKLAEHFRHIHQINYERNLKTIEQIKEINRWLLNEDIKPIYLKGTGNLLDGLYSDIGERIFGDIDFLVSEKDFIHAAEILKQNGYKHSDPFYPDNTYRYKHFPRLYKQDVPVDVEIHQRPIEMGYNYFNYEIINPDKRHALLYPDCYYVMSDKHKLIMNFFHGYKAADVRSHVSFRNLYDFYLLSKRVNAIKTLTDFGHYQRQSNLYIHFAYHTLSLDNKLIKRNWRDRIFTQHFHLQMNNKLAYGIFSFIGYSMFLTTYRVKTLCNKKTRLPAIKSYTRRVIIKPLSKLWK